MSKIFNTSGDCKPGRHYMVDISEKLSQIKSMVDAGKYFTINRARQYGKTTTLKALERLLTKEYQVIRLDFQILGQADFETEQTFVRAFSEELLETIEHLPDEIKARLEAFAYDGSNKWLLRNLFRTLSKWCSIADQKIILMIDEVDSASNNQVFLDFLAQLRSYYLDREISPTFQSVILAGVYDIKNMKMKIRPGDGHKTNSPWNVAADFDVDMSFSSIDIKGMLAEYEQDYKTGMDIDRMAEMIYEYTSGYPFLVSRICQIIDEKLTDTQNFPEMKSAWTKKGFLEAVRILLSEKNTLFETLVNKLGDYPELKKILHAILFTGDTISFNHDNETIDLAFMLGFIKETEGAVAIANRIFEIRLYNLFLSEEEINNRIFTAGVMGKNQFIHNGMLDMPLILEKFMICWEDLYHSADEKFIEDNGRKFFMLFLKPIINGVGNYYIES